MYIFSCKAFQTSSQWNSASINDTQYIAQKTAEKLVTNKAALHVKCIAAITNCCTNKYATA